MKGSKLHSLCIVATLLALASLAWAQDDDSLYIGGYFDNTVKRFDARTGAYQGIFVAYSGAPLAAVSPTGLVFDHRDHSLVVNFQNATLPINGEVDKFDDKTGSSEGALIPSSDPNGPPAPYGLVIKNDVALIASSGGIVGGEGGVQAFDADLGNFLSKLLFDPVGVSPITADTYHPLGEVIGPDGLLYVANDPGTNGGQVLVFNPKTGTFVTVFASTTSCGCDFNRPNGLVFSPDGKLYVTSYAFKDSSNNPTSTDKILVFAGPWSEHPGKYLDHIDLDQVGAPRTYPADILFGPWGKLYVPIFTTGEVRRYDTKTKTYTVFVSATTSPLSFPFGLTFGQTDPATLAYGDEGDSR